MAGCATRPPMEWARVDTKPIDLAAFEVDRTICRGETQKSNLVAPAPEGIGSAIRRSNAIGDVFVGCMAQHGYVQQAVQ